MHKFSSFKKVEFYKCIFMLETFFHLSNKKKENFIQNKRFYYKYQS